MTSPSQTATPTPWAAVPFVIFWKWFRGPSTWWEKIKYPIPWIAAASPALLALRTFIIKSKASTATDDDLLILAGALVAAFVALVKLTETYRDAKKTADTRTEVTKATERAQEQWAVSTSLLKGGITLLYEHFDPNNQTRAGAQTGEVAIRHQLTTIAATTKMLFPDAGHIRVNLCVPNRTGNLTVAVYHQPDDSTHEGKTLPVHSTNPRPGAATARLRMQDQYVDNTHTKHGRLRVGFEAGRPYRSILSWVVMKPNSRRLIAIVNIDSPCAQGFGSPEDSTVRQLARRVSEPALACISLALLDEDVLRHHREK